MLENYDWIFNAPAIFRMFAQWRTKLSDLRRPNKSGIKIVITDCEANIDVLPTPRSLQLLYNKYPQLQRVDNEFSLFLDTVKNDLTEKIGTIVKYKVNKTSDQFDKNFANVQLFMMQQYLQRMNKFDFLCKRSLLKLSTRFLTGNDVGDKVQSHIDITIRMKRRMKRMMDISEKYVVLDVIESVDQMKHHCDNLDSVFTDRVNSKLSSSLYSLDSVGDVSRDYVDFTLTWRSKSMSDPLDQDKPKSYPRRSRTLKSVTEHLSVMTKTFNLNKQ